MSRPEPVIAALENAPAMIIPLVREVPDDILKRRPTPGKWSVHEHACHLATVHPLFNTRLDMMLTQSNPTIRPYSPDKDDEEDALLKIDLKEAMGRFAHDRRQLVERLKGLPGEDWNRRAEH